MACRYSRLDVLPLDAMGLDGGVRDCARLMSSIPVRGRRQQFW